MCQTILILDSKQVAQAEQISHADSSGSQATQTFPADKPDMATLLNSHTFCHWDTSFWYYFGGLCSVMLL